MHNLLRLPLNHADAARARRRSIYRRRGWTLIELLATMALLTAMTGISAKILTTLLRSERNGTEHVVRLVTVSRLARQFRADVHAAIDLQLSGDNPQQPLVTITGADQRKIQYEIQPRGILRTEQRPAQPAASHDLLRLPGTRFRIVDSATPPRLLTLVVETPDTFALDPRQPADNAREVRIDAIVGRDFRDD